LIALVLSSICSEQVRAQMKAGFYGTLNATRAIVPIMRDQRQDMW